MLDPCDIINCLLWCCFLVCVHLPFITAPLIFCFVQVFWFSHSWIHLQYAPHRCIHLRPLYLILGTNFHMTITYTDTDWLMFNWLWTRHHQLFLCHSILLSSVQWGIYIHPNVDCLYGLSYLVTNTAIQSTTKQITHILIQQFVPECTADEKKRIHTSFFTAIRTFGKCIREINTTFG
jgi:hypothetical protein